ncbi:MAG TPA: DUF4062 domain-containing protein [Pseudonocardiaceae bacterium]|nr:DUF4062 domain-containing protein [Pseudonocardiaceae bacterium]
MERREQVFVSSTYLDLREERQAVIQGLLEADCIPAGMELFPASDSDKWSLIRGVIEDSDYYLLIIGGRYGSVDSESELSYTEKEFDYAATIGKPIMAFLHGKPGSIAVEKSEIDADVRAKLDSFRAKAEQRIVKYWTSPQDLDGAVAKSLIKIRKSNPAEGWVRASHAMTPEMERDVAELRAKVSDLTQQLDAARRGPQIAVPEGLADGADIYNLQVTMKYYKEVDREEPIYVRPSYNAFMVVPVAWNTIVAHVGPSLLDEASEKVISTDLRAIAVNAMVDFNNDQFPEGFGGDIEISVESESLKDVIIQLFALGLISHGAKKRPVNNSQKYWRLTESGRDRMMVLRAIRRESNSPSV